MSRVYQRPPYKAALLFEENKTPEWAVFENRWGGALISRHENETAARAEAARLNPKPKEA